MRLPISVFIIALNEEDRIGEAVRSVIGWVDEVFVIDSGSTDNTIRIALELGAQTLFHEWQGYGVQKRFGEDQCRNDWILNLDADEWVTPTLKAEILDLFQSNKIQSHDFWTVSIRNVWPHETTAPRYAYGYKQIRLYRKSVGRFSESTVHDTVRPPEDATEGHLQAHMNHRSMRSITFQFEKINRYSTMQVADMRKHKRKFPRFRLLTDLPIAFLKAYFVRGYWHYGWWGIVVSMNHAIGRYMRVAKYVEAELMAKSNQQMPASDEHSRT